MPVNTQNNLSILDETVRASLVSASEYAYKSLAERAYNTEEIHRLGVCYQATALMVDSLLDNGYRVEHEIRSGWTVPEHSYVVLDTGLEDEIVIDPTWQQFLPKNKITLDMPKVLIGTRDDVIGQARYFGVDELTTQLWQKQGIKMTVEQRKRADLEAKQEADLAEENGAWERFMTQSR